jgi:hypothetical protein
MVSVPLERLRALEALEASLPEVIAKAKAEDNARFILESYLGAKGVAEPVAEAAVEAGDEDAEETAEEPVANTLTHA